MDHLCQTSRILKLVDIHKTDRFTKMQQVIEQFQRCCTWIEHGMPSPGNVYNCLYVQIKAHSHYYNVRGCDCRGYPYKVEQPEILSISHYSPHWLPINYWYTNPFILAKEYNLAKKLAYVI